MKLRYSVSGLAWSGKTLRCGLLLHVFLEQNFASLWQTDARNPVVAFQTLAFCPVHFCKESRLTFVRLTLDK
jgi:hypothetical protein